MTGGPAARDGSADNVFRYTKVETPLRTEESEMARRGQAITEDTEIRCAQTLSLVIGYGNNFASHGRGVVGGREDNISPPYVMAAYVNA